MTLRNPTLGVLVLLGACASPRMPPEADLAPTLALADGERVALQARAADGAPLPAEALAEAAACALEQSTTLDFLVSFPDHARPPAEPDPPAAEADLLLEPLPASPLRWRLRIEARRRSDGASTRLEAVLPGPDLEHLLAGMDALGRSLRRTLGEPLPAVLGQSQPLARACSAHPHALLALARGRQAAREGRIPEAGELLEQALRHDPSCARARLLLASLLLDGEARDAALRLLEVAGLGLPALNAVDRHRIERLRLRAAGAHEELRLLGERFLESHPGNPEGAFSLGLALNQLGNHRRAEPIWRRLCARDPGSATACFQLGVALFGLGRHAEAAAVWEGLDARGAHPVQAAFFPALARLAAAEGAAALAHLESFMPRARDKAALRARLRLLLCAGALLAGEPARAEEEAAAVLAESRADPAGTLSSWGLAARFLLYRRLGAVVERFLAALPLDAPACPPELRLTALWLQGLDRARTPGSGAADQAAARLRECRWIQEACHIDAALAAGRGNPSARIFNLREAVLANPSPWNRLLLAAGLLEEGKRPEAVELLEALSEAGLALDLARLDRHPAANPLSAAALVEARRRLAEAGDPR